MHALRFLSMDPYFLSFPGAAVNSGDVEDVADDLAHELLGEYCLGAPWIWHVNLIATFPMTNSDFQSFMDSPVRQNLHTESANLHRWFAKLRRNET